MRLYVSGPMTGLPEHNYPTFAAATQRPEPSLQEGAE